MNGTRLRPALAWMMLLVLALSNTAIASPHTGLAGKRCMENSFQLLTAIPGIHASRFGKPTAGETIIAISTVGTVDRARQLGTVIGFIYQTGNGTLYYGPRSESSYPSHLIPRQVEFIKRLERRESTKVNPEDIARVGSIALIPANIVRLKSAMHAQSLVEHPCIAWPKGKALPK